MTPHKFRQARDAARAAADAFAEIEKNASPRRQMDFDDEIAGLEVAMLTTRVALHDAAIEYNAHAPDARGVRDWLVGVVTSERDALVAARAPDDVPALDSYAPDALSAHVEAIDAQRAAYAAHRVTLGAIAARVTTAIATAMAAHQMVWHARAAAGLPTPQPLFPIGFELHGHSVASYAKLLDALAACAVSVRTSGADEFKLDKCRTRIAQVVAERAKAERKATEAAA